jgi:protoporphyrinogen oxidase
VQYIIIEQNLQTTTTKHLDVPNKLYELLEQICIRVEQIKQTTGMKYLYVPNKLYEMPEQICIHVC